MSVPSEPSQEGLVSFGDVVVVVIRILALWFTLNNLTTLFILLAQETVMVRVQVLQSAFRGEMFFTVILYVLLLLLAYWVWVFAPTLGRWMTRGRGAVLPPAHFDLRDLYSFGFVLVGLICVLESLGPSITWLHYTVTHPSPSGILTEQQKQNFYTLFKYLLELIIGLALTFNSQKLAAKLLKRQAIVGARSSAMIG
jgi:hypothetical protein